MTPAADATPIERLVSLAASEGLTARETRTGTTGAKRIFAFDRPMTRAVRRAGRRDPQLTPIFWALGTDNSLREGFEHRATWEQAHFPVPFWSMARLKFHLRQARFQRDIARSRRQEERIRTALDQPDAKPLLLDRNAVSPGSGEYQRISAATSVVWRRVSADLAPEGLKAAWCYGDSHTWGFIIAVPSEQSRRELMGAEHLSALARRLIDLLAQTVVLADDFTLRLEIDSDERVNAAEGWQFRLRGDGPPEAGSAWHLIEGRVARCG